MRRIITLICALCLLLSFSACANGGFKPSETDGKTEEEDSDKAPTTSPDDDEENSAGSNEEDEETNGNGDSVENTEENAAVIYIYINGQRAQIELVNNSATKALTEILKKGDITYTANDYGNFEKVGSLGHTLPTENAQITAEPGDVILYSSNQIVIFYGNNSWSYTRLGKINGLTENELRELLCAGDGSVQITLSLK